MYENIHDNDTWGRIKCNRNCLERIVLEVSASLKTMFITYIVRSETHFAGEREREGSYRTRLLFPVKFMSFQIVEGTEPFRLLSSSDLQHKNIM